MLGSSGLKVRPTGESMRDSQILSAFQESALHSLSATESGALNSEAAASPSLVFDACHVGVVLRAVLYVEAVLGVATMFTTFTFMEWLAKLSLSTGAALPATLAWLIAACSMKNQLARLPVAGQYAAGIALGALAGLYGCGLLALTGYLLYPPWVASGFSGALLAAALVVALALRAKGQAPAATAARLTELQARIRPHFLFNTLNSAIALVRDEPAKAEAILEDLSDLFRHALVDQGESVTLAEEIELARRYLAIEQVRFGDRLRVTWSIDPEAGNARVPPLLLQPLVENAVLHGVEPNAKGADVTVSTQKRGAIAVIKVFNTVTPAAMQRKGHGIALNNVRDRLDLLHDVRGHFNCGIKNDIFLVRIEVPA